MTGVTSTEFVIQTVPFIVRRTVKWGECDPAGVVYTVVFGEYVISAAELFYRYLFNEGPQHAKDHHGFGTPTRGLTFDFRSSLRPDDEFEMEVSVDEIRSRTYSLVVHGRTLTGTTVFIAKLTPICVIRGQRQAIPVPAILRDALLAYQNEYAASQGSGH